MPKPLTPETAFARASLRCATTEYCLSDWRNKLTAQGLTPQETESVLQRLQAERYIDEARYARAFVTDKAVFDHWGAAKIRQALTFKKIPEDFIQAALDLIDTDWWEHQLKTQLLQKKRSTKAASNYELRQKLIRFAARRGFEPGMILDTIDRLDLEEDD